MNSLGKLGTYDCSTCQSLCCVASGRKGLPGNLSLVPSQACPNIALVGDCVSCSVHDTLYRDPSMATCHLFDCRGVGNRFSDMLTRSWVHWMKDAPLSAEKQVVFDNVVYFFDLVSTVVAFWELLKETHSTQAHAIVMHYVEKLLINIDTDCQNGISSRERLVDYWLEITDLVKQLPHIQLPKLMGNARNFNTTIRDGLIAFISKKQPNKLLEDLIPTIEEYVFAYSTITFFEAAIHSREFDKTFHDRAVEYAITPMHPDDKEFVKSILDALYAPIRVTFQG